MRSVVTSLAIIVVAVVLAAAEIKVDLSKERVGRPPATFEPIVGTWSWRRMAQRK